MSKSCETKASFSKYGTTTDAYRPHPQPHAAPLALCHFSFCGRNAPNVTRPHDSDPPTLANALRTGSRHRNPTRPQLKTLRLTEMTEMTAFDLSLGGILVPYDT